MKRADRQRLADIVADLSAWMGIASEIRRLTAHMPMTRAVVLDAYLAWLLAELEGLSRSGDLSSAKDAVGARWFNTSKPSPGSDAAAARLIPFHAGLVERGDPSRLDATLGTFRGQASSEWQHLQATLDAQNSHAEGVREALLDDAHMPFSAQGVLSQAERESLTRILEQHDLLYAPALRILDGATCGAALCEASHAAVADLLGAQAGARSTGLWDQTESAVARVASMTRTERGQAERLINQVDDWVRRSAEIRGGPRSAWSAVEHHRDHLLSLAVNIGSSGQQDRVIPLADEDMDVRSALARLRDSSVPQESRSFLDHFEETVRAHSAAARWGFDDSWECLKFDNCSVSHEALRSLRGLLRGSTDRLERIETEALSPRDVPSSVLDESLGLADILGCAPGSLNLLERPVVDVLRANAPRVVNIQGVTKAAQKRAKKAAEAVRASDIRASLLGMDLDVLKKAATGSIRGAALSRAGLSNVWAVYSTARESSDALTVLPGLGYESARNAAQASLRLFEGVRDDMPVRIDVKARGAETVELLKALREWDIARRLNPTKEEVTACAALRIVFERSAGAGRLLVAPPRDVAQPTGGAVELLNGLSQRLEVSYKKDIWSDFLSRPADFFGMLTELGFTTEDERRMHGDLPDEIIEAVRDQELDRTYLTSSLRAYQSFGARFALVQKKIVLGDEMGLGKTVEALAVMTHLRATKGSHFLVVCPAAVVSNWTREVAKHTQLRAFRIHGNEWERTHHLKTWQRDGGIAVTTYGLLGGLLNQLRDTQISCVALDEAHYIKRPSALRSQASATVIEQAEHVLLMTGTPLENSVQEFRNLIGYVRPELADSAPDFLASQFRKHVAPVYLRRNQEDVLTELPELVEVEEWLGTSPAEDRNYRDAVRTENFMMMRRAAMLTEQSPKLERLKEIVEEAEANGRRIIVFSYFRDVLTRVATEMPGAVFGPLTGSTAPAERQALVDRFSKAPGGAVLVAQITAGGVGLNIQAASIVVICEPQLKPTAEDQAIARAHRMGQTDSVQVHRLLTEGGVDERIREILAEKRQLFDEFARDSVIAKRAPDAVDVSDAELARLVIAAERERLFGGVSAGAGGVT